MNKLLALPPPLTHQTTLTTTRSVHYKQIDCSHVFKKEKPMNLQSKTIYLTSKDRPHPNKKNKNKVNKETFGLNSVNVKKAKLGALVLLFHSSPGCYKVLLVDQELNTSFYPSTSPLDTKQKPNTHKTSRRHPGRPLNVVCMFYVPCPGVCVA